MYIQSTFLPSTFFWILATFRSMKTLASFIIIFCHTDNISIHKQFNCNLNSFRNFVKSALFALTLFFDCISFVRCKTELRWKIIIAPDYFPPFRFWVFIMFTSMKVINKHDDNVVTEFLPRFYITFLFSLRISILR